MNPAIYGVEASIYRQLTTGKFLDEPETPQSETPKAEAPKAE